MSRGVLIGKGGAGRGKYARSIQVQGPAAKYARIFETGETIRPVNFEHLAVPADANKKKDGQAKKSMWRFEDYQTFTMTPKGSGVKTVFLKKGGKKTTSKYGNVYLKHYPKKPNIVPIFFLVKEQRIEATRWASKALDEAQRQIHPIIAKTMRQFFRRGRKFRRKLF